MYFDFEDNRKPLASGETVTIEMANGSVKEYVIDREAGRGGLAITYIAYDKNESPTRWVALKELFPRGIFNAWTERDDNGKIVIKRMSGKPIADEDDPLWEDMRSYFKHEANMNERARALYDKDGNRVKQNNPDVLAVAGPYTATNRNCYLVIDTNKGESLESFIEQGWDSPEARGKKPNSRISGLLGILKQVTKLLSQLHGDARMYHLDLSTANIYLSERLGGRELAPYIIDFGSAYLYNREEAEGLGAHRFTCNPFSAPEINALAELQDEDCGYSPSASSDTYSIVAILFYAVTGKIYSAEMLFSSDWKKLIRAHYPKEVYDGFTRSLIEFFDTGLASAQSERFRNANTLYRALDDLSKLFDNKGLLSKIEPDERMSYLILHRHPLYEYAVKDELNVLCLGSGKFVERMVLTMISTGQMLDKKLKIHIVSNQAESLKTALISAAPELKKYSNLGENLSPYEYVTFEFEDFTFDFDDAKKLAKECKQIAKAHKDCHYVVISLGSNNHNVDLARCYAGALGSYTKQKSIVHYYMGEDIANNLRSDISVSGIPDSVTLSVFSEHEYAAEAVELGRNAFRVHYLYEKQSNPKASREESMKRFLDDAYSQKSSAASALHAKYKLASVGVNPKPDKSEKSKALRLYSRALDTQKGRLLELEHRRWMMYMIADGYRNPDWETIKAYSFEEIGGKLNNSFKNKAEKYHHCLVPCSDSGVVLRNLSHKEWDSYSNTQIRNSNYDPLDKISLKVHRLAGEKIKKGEAAEKIRKILTDKIKRSLKGNDGLEEERVRFSKWVDGVLEHPEEDPRRFEEKLACFESECREHLNPVKFAEIDGQIKKITEAFAVYKEFGSYVDYKAPDEAIVDNLLWIYYAQENLRLIKLVSNRAIDNIASVLSLEPQNVCYLGDGAYKRSLESFFKGHGNNTTVIFEDCDLNDEAAMRAKLGRLIESMAGEAAAVDITGLSDLQLIAAMKCLAPSKLPIIYFDSQTQTVRGIRHFKDEAVYRLKNSISATEAYAIFGAIENQTPDSDYIIRLNDHIDKMWSFYQKHKEQWTTISLFFKLYGSTAEVYEPHLKRSENSTAHDYEGWMSKEIYQNNDFNKIFEHLRSLGIINSYNHQYYETDVEVKMKYPDYLDNSKFEKAMDALFTTDWSRGAPIDKSKQSNGTRKIELASGRYVMVDTRAVTDRYTQKTHEWKALFKPLEELKNLNLIRMLKTVDEAGADGTDGKFKIEFYYNYNVIKDCLAKEGNILEAYVWCKAHETGYFDDVKANFSFGWSDSSPVKNELDVVLAKGLSTVVVSCKMARYNKEHLYEVKYLADRFSVNSKAVIVYSSDRAYDGDDGSDGTIEAVRNRAKEMGVYLLDGEDLEGDNLGKALIEIAEGKRSL